MIFNRIILCLALAVAIEMCVGKALESESNSKNSETLVDVEAENGEENRFRRDADNEAKLAQAEETLDRKQGDLRTLVDRTGEDVQDETVDFEPVVDTASSKQAKVKTLLQNLSILG